MKGRNVLKNKYKDKFTKMKARQNWARLIAKVMKKNRIQKKATVARRKRNWRSWARRRGVIGPPSNQNWIKWARNKRYEARRASKRFHMGYYQDPYRYLSYNRPYRWRD